MSDELNNEASQKLQTAGGAEREARAFDFECTRADDHDYQNCEKCARMRKKLTVALEKCANEARLEALEQAAVSMEKLHQGAEDYYTFEIGHVRADGAAAIRAIKAAPAVAMTESTPQQLRDAEPKG